MTSEAPQMTKLFDDLVREFAATVARD